MKLADSHTHLSQLEDDVTTVLKDSPEVKLLVNIGTLLEDDFTELLKQDEVYCTYGIHPNDYLKEKSSTLNHINDLEFLYHKLKTKITETPKCAGIGETGLDFYYGKENDIQYDLLHMHLALGKELKKPISIHARECNLEELLKIIYSYDVSFVLHCYSYDLKNAMLAIEHGAYISFSGILTFGKNTEHLEETAKHIPEERILIETDAPYLAPVPFRGKKNHPKYLIHTLKKLGELRKEPIEQTAQYTFNNTLKFYKINNFVENE